MEELNRSLDGTNSSLALAAGFKARSGGRSAGRGGRNGGGRGKRDGKVARRISGSRNISRGISESSPGISRNNNSISRGTSESSPRISSGTSNISDRSRNSSTSGISRDISRSSQHSIQGDRVHHAFVSGVVNTGIFCQSAAQYPLHRTRVFLTRTRARKLLLIHILETAPILGAGLLHHPSQPGPAPPDPHDPPVPSESSSSSFTDQATLGQFAPPGKLRVPSATVVGNITVPGSFLHSSFIVQSGNSEGDIWIADSGASCYMTHDRTRIYNVSPPPSGRATITIGDRRKIKVEYIGNMDVIFHGKPDQRTTLIDVAYVPGLGFNLYSLHAVQITHLLVLDASGTHIIGENTTFPRSSGGSYLLAPRHPARTVGARRRQGDMRATNLLRQLRHPVSPPPQEIPPHRNMCATGMHNSNVSGAVTVLEPTLFPPFSSVLGEIKFVGKTRSRSESRIGTRLAATALTSGLLKHGKEIDINHLHVFLCPRPCVCAGGDSETAWDPLDRGISFTFGFFSGERVSGTYSTSRDEASDAAARTCSHRHR